jgi:type VI secretion system secreted protein VgrG
MASSKLDIDAAVKYLDDHAKTYATGFCARAVRSAILAGGVNISPHPGIAKSYGIYLQRSGFKLQPSLNYNPKKGDVVVIQNYAGGQPAGHIAMYDGTQWVSDFKQKDMWAGPGYRKHKPSYAVYRPGV